ncbi:unnamed protein product [Cladocopium goreaui]|uniref:UPF0762 protein n=1 Tax=Cladocopium goreaui TaxID=2562237 RepID=A0A9P1C1G3_9DINO|nr:unnamed protein product [Cladocopium goreaui]
MALELRELLWTLRSSVAAVELRLELLRRTWPRSPPEWLEEEEVRDLLRPYLESSQLPLLLQLLHSAPRAWCNATRTRTRTLLALVEPCDVHLLRVRLDVIFGLSPEMCAGRCYMRLRLAKAGSWMESSSFFLAVPPFPSRPAGCFLDNEFQFSIPVSSGDSVLSLFGPGATGLEVQLVDEDRSPLLQGELSPAEFLAHMELGPGEAAASCIKLEPAESFQCTGLKSCSVAGLMAGPQLQLVLRCSQMAAPLDALPYWAEPRLATPWQPLPKVTMEESGATDLAPQTETVSCRMKISRSTGNETEVVVPHQYVG